MIENIPVQNIETTLIEQKNKCLLLHGPPGIGKTSNAANFALKMIEKNWTSLWFSSETKANFLIDLEALTDLISDTNHEWIESFFTELSKNVFTIVTSRKQNILDEVACEIKIAYFNEKEAKHFIIKN